MYESFWRSHNENEHKYIFANNQSDKQTLNQTHDKFLTQDDSELTIHARFNNWRLYPFPVPLLNVGLPPLKTTMHSNKIHDHFYMWKIWHPEKNKKKQKNLCFPICKAHHHDWWGTNLNLIVISRPQCLFGPGISFRTPNKWGGSKPKYQFEKDKVVLSPYINF